MLCTDSSMRWDCCRQALKQLKMPLLMSEDVLEAFFKQNMVVPTTKYGWELFRRELADAVALLFTPTYLDTVEAVTNPTELSVSYLIRDMQAREYDFSGTLDNSGVHPYPQTVCCSAQ